MGLGKKIYHELPAELEFPTRSRTEHFARIVTNHTYGLRHIVQNMRRFHLPGNTGIGVQQVTG